MWRKTVAMASFFLAVLGNTSIGLGYEVTEVINGSTIAGRIAFTGTPPAPRMFEVKKEPEVCGQVRGLTKVEVHHGLLKGAVVVLEGLDKGKPFESKTFKAEAPGEGEFRYGTGGKLNLGVWIKNCNFGPFTGVVAAGHTLKVSNQDSIKHVLHTYVLKGRNANILRTVNVQNLPAHSEREHELKPNKLKHGRVIAFTCDRHDFMENWLYVVKSPYFAISDQDGNYTLDQVPPGQYELVVWHPVLGIQKQAVQIEAGYRVEANFTFAK